MMKVYRHLHYHFCNHDFPFLETLGTGLAANMSITGNFIFYDQNLEFAFHILAAKQFEFAREMIETSSNSQPTHASHIP